MKHSLKPNPREADDRKDYSRGKPLREGKGISSKGISSPHLSSGKGWEDNLTQADYQS